LSGREDTNLVPLTGVRPLGRSGWYNYYGCASIDDMAEQFPGLIFQGSGSQTLIICSTSCP
jgi:hypothetical protein